MSQQRKQRRSRGSALLPAVDLDKSFEAQRELTQNFLIDPQIIEPTKNNQQLESSRKRKSSEVVQNQRKKGFKKEQEERKQSPS
jgi:hypothetical protein